MKILKVLLITTLALGLTACSESEKTVNPPADSGATAPVIDSGVGSSDSGATAMDASVCEPDETADWGKSCSENTDCPTPTDFCVKQPNEPMGYCAVRCSKTSECTALGVPSNWTCNAVFMACDGSDLTWCGPDCEIGLGPISECK